VLRSIELVKKEEAATGCPTEDVLLILDLKKKAQTLDWPVHCQRSFLSHQSEYDTVIWTIGSENMFYSLCKPIMTKYQSLSLKPKYLLSL
jgi:hypothetical protein